MKNKNKTFSVLMYHEISSTSRDQADKNYMTPIYNLSFSVFEKQLMAIRKTYFTTGLLDNVRDKVSESKRMVFLSFDDGFIGNYTKALPLLLKYGQKATFFVTTNLIGKNNYMSWNQVRELSDEGMAIQSHAMNHIHLTGLSDKILKKELLGSKKMIEDEISKKVKAISFPHGSYNKQTIKCAIEVGYSIICTSDVYLNSTILLKNNPAILGRIAITTKTTIDSYIGYIQGRRNVIYKEQLIKGSKNLLKRILGLENYGKLYRLYFNIKED